MLLLSVRLFWPVELSLKQRTYVTASVLKLIEKPGWPSARARKMRAMHRELRERERESLRRTARHLESREQYRKRGSRGEIT